MHISRWPSRFHLKEFSLCVCVYLYTRGAAAQVSFFVARRKAFRGPVYSLLLAPLFPREKQFASGGTFVGDEPNLPAIRRLRGTVMLTTYLHRE